jgi:hypothetical protein
MQNGVIEILLPRSPSSISKLKGVPQVSFQETIPRRTTASLRLSRESTRYNPGRMERREHNLARSFPVEQVEREERSGPPVYGENVKACLFPGQASRTTAAKKDSPTRVFRSHPSPAEVREPSRAKDSRPRTHPRRVEPVLWSH